MAQPERKITSDEIAASLRALSAYSHLIAERRGFTIGQQNVGELLMLAVRDLSGAMEPVKKGKRLAYTATAADGKPVGFGAKLADCIIQVSDIAARTGVDLGASVIAKLEYNRKKATKRG